MSVRVHVVGAFGATDAEFRAALDQVGDDGSGSRRFRIGSSGNWMWANASVWNVGGAEIETALATLDVPALRVTSSDGVLWTLTLIGPGREPFRGVHHFTMVGSEPEEPVDGDDGQDDEFPDDEIDTVAGINKFVPELQFLWDAEEAARLQQESAAEAAENVEGLDDYTDYGVQLPPSAINQMKRDPNNADYTAFMAHGPQVVDALHQYGLEFDRDEILRLLTTGPLTEREEYSEIGNMPRFLQYLGIDGVFQEGPDDEAEVAAEDELEETEDAEPPIDGSTFSGRELFATIDPLVKQCPLTEIDGGPVNILGYGALLHLIAHMLQENPTTLVRVGVESDRPTPTDWLQSVDDLEIRRDGPHWEYAFSTRLWWTYTSEPEDLENNPLTELFIALPDGTPIELAFLVGNLSEKCHRYAGRVQGKYLLLDRVWPQTPANALSEAVDLASQCFAERSIALAPEEEQVVRHNYQRSTGEVAKIRNGRIMPEQACREVVVQTLLLERFAGRVPWDIAEARRQIEADWELYDQVASGNYQADDDDEEEELDEQAAEEVGRFEDMMQQLAQAAEHFKQSSTVPHSDDVLYTGRTGNFYRASLSDLEHVSQEHLDRFDANMRALGFECLGDSAGDVDQRQEISRCYVGEQALALHSHRTESNQFGWAPVSNGAVLVDFSGGTVEFHTHFQDGTTLVTTSIDAVTSKPDQGIYVRCYEDIPLTSLWEKHLDGIARFRDHRGTVPVDHRQFSEDVRLFEKLDNLLSRFLEID